MIERKALVLKNYIMWFLLINVTNFTAPGDYKKSPFRVRKLGLSRNFVTSRKCVRSELYALQVWQHYRGYRTVNTRWFKFDRD